MVLLLQDLEGKVQPEVMMTMVVGVRTGLVGKGEGLR